MNLLKHFGGNISFLGKTPAIPLVKEILSQHYRIETMSESENSLKCIVVRRYRSFWYPWMGPHTRLSILIENDLRNSIISYSFFWPEYLFFWGISVLIGIAILFDNADILFAVGIAIFFSTLYSIAVFLDGYFFSGNIRKLLLKHKDLS